MTTDPLSNFPGFPDSNRISFDANNVYLNFQGLYYNQTNQAIFDVQFASAAIPETATLALLGAGLAGLGFSRRRTLN